MMNIVTLGNDILRAKAEPVKNIDGRTAKLAVDMLETLLAAKGLGLAGPQVGLGERIFVVHLGDDIPRIFINPEILEASPDLTKYEEGCLSVPGIWANVTRPGTVKIRAWNEKGKQFTMEADDLLARVIQHEFDHLNGTLIIDRTSRSARAAALRELRGREDAGLHGAVGGGL